MIWLVGFSCWAWLRLASVPGLAVVSQLLVLAQSLQLLVLAPSLQLLDLAQILHSWLRLDFRTLLAWLVPLAFACKMKT